MIKFWKLTDLCQNFWNAKSGLKIAKVDLNLTFLYPSEKISVMKKPQHHLLK